MGEYPVNNYLLTRADRRPILSSVNVPPHPSKSPLANPAYRAKLESVATALIERNGGLLTKQEKARLKRQKKKARQRAKR